MESTFEILRSEAGTLLARLIATKEFVSEYDKDGKILFVKDNFNLPTEEFVRSKLKDYAKLPIVSIA